MWAANQLAVDQALSRMPHCLHAHIARGARAHGRSATRIAQPQNVSACHWCTEHHSVLDWRCAKHGHDWPCRKRREPRGWGSDRRHARGRDEKAHQDEPTEADHSERAAQQVRYLIAQQEPATKDDER
jgi:hypothetical protein